VRTNKPHFLCSLMGQMGSRHRLPLTEKRHPTS
jgi:hypothetical protein